MLARTILAGALADGLAADLAALTAYRVGYDASGGGLLIVILVSLLWWRTWRRPPRFGA